MGMDTRQTRLWFRGNKLRSFRSNSQEQTQVPSASLRMARTAENQPQNKLRSLEAAKLRSEGKSDRKSTTRCFGIRLSMTEFENIKLCHPELRSVATRAKDLVFAYPVALIFALVVFVIALYS
jgi:hypothetical protein